MNPSVSIGSHWPGLPQPRCWLRLTKGGPTNSRRLAQPTSELDTSNSAPLRFCYTFAASATFLHCYTFAATLLQFPTSYAATPFSTATLFAKLLHLSHASRRRKNSALSQHITEAAPRFPSPRTRSSVHPRSCYTFAASATFSHCYTFAANFVFTELVPGADYSGKTHPPVQIGAD